MLEKENILPRFQLGLVTQLEKITYIEGFTLKSKYKSKVIKLFIKVYLEDYFETNASIGPTAPKHLKFIKISYLIYNMSWRHKSTRNVYRIDFSKILQCVKIKACSCRCP